MHINKSPDTFDIKLCFPASSGCPSLDLLALDAEPKHVLPVCHIGMFLHKVYVGGQQELPASVDPGRRHMLQEVLHIVWRKLCRGSGKKELISHALSEKTLKRNICSLQVKDRVVWCLSQQEL